MSQIENEEFVANLNTNTNTDIDIKTEINTDTKTDIKIETNTSVSTETGILNNNKIIILDEIWNIIIQLIVIIKEIINRLISKIYAIIKQNIINDIYVVSIINIYNIIKNNIICVICVPKNIIIKTNKTIAKIKEKIIKIKGITKKLRTNIYSFFKENVEPYRSVINSAKEVKNDTIELLSNIKSKTIKKRKSRNK